MIVAILLTCTAPWFQSKSVAPAAQRGRIATEADVDRAIDKACQGAQATLSRHHLSADEAFQLILAPRERLLAFGGSTSLQMLRSVIDWTGGMS
jgi:hypothetical protein